MKRPGDRPVTLENLPSLEVGPKNLGRAKIELVTKFEMVRKIHV